MTTDNDALKGELEFRLSLLRLLTEPHHTPEKNQPSSESRQLEQLVEIVPARY